MPYQRQNYVKRGHICAIFIFAQKKASHQYPDKKLLNISVTFLTFQTQSHFL